MSIDLRGERTCNLAHNKPLNRAGLKLIGCPNICQDLLDVTSSQIDNSSLVEFDKQFQAHKVF